MTVKLCAVDGCSKTVKGRGRLCSAHYERKRLYGEPTAPAPNTRPWRGGVCVVPGCGRPNRALGLCRVHVQRAYAHNGDPLAGRWTAAIPPGHEGPAPLHPELVDGYRPPVAPDPLPVRALRRELCVQRHERVPFDVAWPLALALVGPDLEPWGDALDFARDEWRAAYQGEPPTMAFMVPDPWTWTPGFDQAVDDLIELL